MDFSWVFHTGFYCLFTLTIYHLLKLFKWIRQRYHLLQTFSSIDIPGPKPSFLLGNISLLDRQYLFESLDKWFQIYGDVLGYYRGDRAILVTKNLNVIHEIFIERFQEFPNRLKFFIEMKPFSSSILALRGHRWRQVRRVLTPAFNATKISSSNTNETIFKSLSRLFSLLSDPNINYDDYIERLNDGSLLVNVSQMSKRYTLDIICRFAFALDNEDLYDPHSSLYRMVEEFFSTCIDNVFIRLACGLPFLKHILRFVNDHVTSGPVIDHLVRFLQQQIIRYNRNNTDIVDEFKPKKNLLDFILHQMKLNNLNLDETIGNLLVILLAGYETTACGLSFVLFNLAKHPEIQDRLRAEVEHLVWNANQKNFDNQIKCEYLDRIIYESLRLYPPVIDYVIRESSDQSPSDEVFINHTTMRIPKHVAIQVPIWIIHHDPQIWPNPNRFDPDRPELPVGSSSSDKINWNRNKFLAFGIGQRSCIGASLALSEIRAIVSTMISRYQIELLETDHESYEYDGNGLLKVKAVAELIEPYKDIRLRLVPRRQADGSP